MSINSELKQYQDKTIEYQGKEVYVSEQFEYKNVMYLYGIVKDTVNNPEPSIVFLYNETGDENDWGYVDDDDLHEELMMYVVTLKIPKILEEDLNEYDELMEKIEQAKQAQN